MTTEDQKLIERIGQLAGQINRHKNQQLGTATAAQHSHHSHHHAATTGYGRGGGGYYRGYASYPYPGQGFRIRKLPVHRNRSLVLNGASGPSKTDDDSGAAGDVASPSTWVSRNDRHLQLINSNVFHEQSQARNKAIAQTRLQQQRQADVREQSQLMNYFNRTANSSFSLANPASAPSYEVYVDGIRFQVTKNGSKLVKLSGDTNSPKATPKMALVGGVKFYRSKNGNLYRQGIVKAQRHCGVKKVNVPCKIFSTTGSCPKGPMCRFVHDPARVSACKDWLLKGECNYGDSCDLSHELLPERTPHCLHYAKGNCSNAHCSYTHRVLSPGAPVCRSFGFYGYCEKGISCPDRHSFECPNFSNTGVCKIKGCKLLHRERASVLRKASAAREQAAANGADDDGDDVSSDDGDSVDSKDFDSDEVEEFMGEQEDSLDFSNQKDFIQF